MLMRNTNTTRNTNCWGKLLCAALAAGAIGFAARPASADERRDHDRHDNGGVRVGVDLNLGGGHREPRYEERRTKVWVEPAYRTVSEKVWVEPTFRTVSTRVWREPVVNIQTERIWVPDRYEERVYYRRNVFGVRVRVTERVLIERGHHENRETSVVVRAGCWETVEHQDAGPLRVAHRARRRRARPPRAHRRAGAGLGH